MDEKNQVHEENTLISEDEILPEEIELDAEGEELSFAEKLKKMRQKVAACEEEKRRCQDDLQRTKADFLNSRRRLEEQFIRDKERIVEKILADLLPLADSFDMAMADTAAWESVDPKWRSGVEAIYAKLRSILKDHDITPLDSIGQPFNPHEHDAVSNVPVDDDKVDHVITVLQKGYKRNDTIIRHAMVTVGAK